MTQRCRASRDPASLGSEHPRPTVGRVLVGVGMSVRPWRLVAPALLVVPVLAVAGCGGSSGISGSSSSDSPGASSGGSTSSPSESSSGGGSGSSCGNGEIDGVTVRTFCGKGTATITSGATSLTLDSAECVVSTNAVVLNAGTIVLGFDDAAKAVKKKTQYIGIAFGSDPSQGLSGAAAAGDGTFKGGVLTAQDDGTGVATRADTVTFTATDGRTKGTATGTTLTGDKVTATWSCGP
jgi:hypothetical protein